MIVGVMGIYKVLFIIFVLIDFLFIGLLLSIFGVVYEYMYLLVVVLELLIVLFLFYGFVVVVLNIYYG